MPFGHIDGNSFYCSVERAFSAYLRGRPLIVLSNNDGCAIARSPEAKSMGVAMGDPMHLLRQRPGMRGLKWVSSNYELYGDMSRRVYEILIRHVPVVEPYSIDEMFLGLDGMPGDLVALCRRIREDVLRLAKIPTCIGLGPTKTIAKLANKHAKKEAALDGVCDLRDAGARAALYAGLPVGEVWGIGGRLAERLQLLGVHTVEHFIGMPADQVRDTMTVVGARIQAELRGVSCLPLSLMAPPRKGIAVTRSFSRPVTQWSEAREAVLAHASRAGEKLREEGMLATRMSVFIHSNPHSGDPWVSAQRGASIEATADTLALVGEATRLLGAIWRAGPRYSKAGIMLTELVPVDSAPAALFPSRDPLRSAKLMAALDAVNGEHGRGALRVASTGIARPWATQAQRRSPRYTTRMGEVLRVWAPK